MRKTILVGFFILAAYALFAQTKTDSNKAAANMIKYDGDYISLNKLSVMTIKNPAAYNEVQIAKDYNGFGTFFGCCGGFLIGWPIGTAIGGGNPNWLLAGIGVGLVLIEIPFVVACKKHKRNAVSIYNNGLLKTSLNTFNLHIGLTCNGISLKMQF